MLSSSKLTNRSSASLLEPESMRLQKNIETFLDKLEHEKRDSNYLDEQIKLAEAELQQIKERTDKSLPKKSETNLKAQVQVLEKKLSLEISHLNDSRSAAKEIRQKIDELRKEKLSSKWKVKSMQEELNYYTTQVQKRNNDLRMGIIVEEKQKEAIQNIRSRSVHQRSKFDEKLSVLTSQIKTDKESRSKLFREINNTFGKKITKPTAAVEITRLLRSMVRKWRDKVITKKKMLEDYIKHINTIKGGFSQIKSATGMSSIGDTVTVFIKSEEQNYELYTYINNLNTEIDILQESLDHMQSTIQSFEVSDKAGNQKINERLKQLKTQQELILNKKGEKQNIQTKVSEQMSQLLPLLKEVLLLCKKTAVSTEVSTGTDLSTIERITEENMTQILGEIEEYLIMFKMLNKKHSKAVGVPFDMIEEKNFYKQPLNIQEELNTADSFIEEELKDVIVPLPPLQMRGRASAFIKSKYPNQKFFNLFSRSVTPNPSSVTY